MRRAVWRAMLVCALALAASATPAATLTPCAPTGAAWCQDTGGVSLSAPTGLSSIGVPKTWSASGGELLTLDSGTGALEFATAGLGSKISSAPMPVQFSSTSRAVFVASNDGYVHRINPDDGTCVWQTFVGRTTDVDISPGCGGGVTAACNGDQVVATPAVRFGATEADAIVYVGTRYSNKGGGACKTKVANRVYALNAVTGQPVWVFNAPNDPIAPGTDDYTATLTPAHNISRISAGAFPDVWDDGCGEPGVRDLIYVGSKMEKGSTDPTLWALDALTGSLTWSLFVDGGVETTPILSYNGDRCGRLYVGARKKNKADPTTVGLHAYGVTATACASYGGAAPCSIWMSGATTIKANFTVAHGGALRGQIYARVKDTAKGSKDVLRVYQDDGATVSEVCEYTPTGAKVKVRSSPLLADDMMYVGLNNGDIMELDRATCGAASTKSRTVDAGPKVKVGDAAIDVDTSFTSPWVVVGTDTGRLARFDLPF